MDYLKERIISGVLLMVLEVIAIVIFLSFGIKDLFTAMIFATPAMAPAFNYRGYVGINRFQYGRYKAEKSVTRRTLETVAIASLAGLPAVPIGLSIYKFTPISAEILRFVMGFLTAIIIVFVISSLAAFQLNSNYLADQR